MASLGELLADDGFRSKPRRARSSAAAEAPRAVSMPLYSDIAGHRSSRNPDSAFLDLQARKQVVYGRSRTSFLRSKERSGYKFDIKGKTFREEREMLKVDQEFDNHTLASEGLHPTIHNAAILAVISILTGYIRVFFADQSFRASLHSGCNSCLEAAGDADEWSRGDDRVLAELEKAMAAIERAVEKGRGGQKDLQKASTKLGVISGLSSSSRSRLAAACAHLYLGVVCAISGKDDRDAASHLLEVFCGAPFEAREVLLPKLWERVFHPQLSHLMAWYEEERDSIAGTVPSRAAKKMKVLDRMYNDVLDLGTREFAVYYKEWLDEETSTAPSTPTVHAPSASLLRVTQGAVVQDSEEDEFSSSRNFLSPKSMFSEIPCQSVSSELKKMDAANLKIREHDGEEDEEKEQAQEIKKTTSKKPDESSYDKENEYALNRLAKAVFELQPVRQHFQSKSSVHVDYLGNNVPLSEVRRTDSTLKKSQLISNNSDNLHHHELIISSFSAELFDTCEYIDQFSVSQQQGFCSSVLVLAAQVAGIEAERKAESEHEDLAFDIVDRLLIGCSKERIENAGNLVALGGLHFLVCRFERGSIEEKTQVVRHLLCCIKANGYCRKYLADNLKRSCVLELLHSKKVSARTNAVILLIELICLNRRRDIDSFLCGFLTETVAYTMHVLLVHLHSSPPEEKALVAVLLLHFDLMLGGHQKSIYKEEAVNAINLALSCCLHDKKAVPNTKRALLMLGGYFSSSGEVLIDSMLQQQLDDGDDDEADSNDFLPIPNSFSWTDLVSQLQEDEARQKEKWERDVSLVLVGNGTESFLATLSKCLVCSDQDVVWTGLVTVAWMSHALVSLSAMHHHAVKQLAALLSLIPQLKEQVQKKEHSVLAAASLHNFTKISSKYLAGQSNT